MQRKSHLLVLTSILSIILYSCTVQKKCIDCAVIKLGILRYDEKMKDYIEDEAFWPMVRILYRDSMAIDEIKRMTITRDSLGREVRLVTVEQYAFTDIRKGWVYKYNSFSDTARVISKHITSDSLGLMHRLYIPTSSIIPNEEPPEELNDTVINNITYKRRRFTYFNKEENKLLDVYINYYRCDINNKVLTLGSKSTLIPSCTGVRSDLVLPDGLPAPSSTQIKYIGNEFTPEELKVFNAWKNNANNHPVVTK
jgi:hypothetical protein